MKAVFCFFISMFVFAGMSPAFSSDGIEKVNIYMGHFLLQSWPQDKRVITMEVDTNFPPDTLVFQAIASAGGIQYATLQIVDMRENVIEEVSRITQNEDETEATFVYVLNKHNVQKIKDRKFRVILDSHRDNEAGKHHVALIFLDVR